MNRRRWVPRILLGTAVVVVLAVAAVFLGPPPSRHGWPQEVTPEVGDLYGILQVTGGDHPPMWAPVEGSQPFVRAVDSSGAVVLEQHFAWPRVEHRLPLGTYAVTVYERICVGNCDNLDPEGSARCEVPVELEYHDDRRLVQVTWDDDGMACDAVRPF